MTKAVHLAAEQAAFVEGLVSAGRYASTDEAIVEGLRLLHARESRLTELRDAWREGIESADYEPLDAILDELSTRYEPLADTGH